MGKWITTDDLSETNMLTKCIGSMGYFKPQWEEGRIKKGDRFLLCSDGFYRNVDENKIAGALSARNIHSQVQLGRSIRTIAGCARRNGEKDNITAICIIT